MKLLSVNVGKPLRHESAGSPDKITGIGKRPVEGPVTVTAPGPRGVGGSGLASDTIGNKRVHGGDHQAVYAYAREDLDDWSRSLDRDLADGAFGENLTTTGVDVNGALIGERWRVGGQVLLEVCSARVPCATFAGWLGERGWIKRFTAAAMPGAYLRVIEPGELRAGDAVEIVDRPRHEVTVSLLFQALTTRPDLLPRVLDARAALDPEVVETALRRTAR
jgi:MOSC domain-containing protein YiiM